MTKMMIPTMMTHTKAEMIIEKKERNIARNARNIENPKYVQTMKNA
jgi:hypothetical protein